MRIFQADLSELDCSLAKLHLCGGGTGVDPTDFGDNEEQIKLFTNFCKSAKISRFQVHIFRKRKKNMHFAAGGPSAF